VLKQLLYNGGDIFEAEYPFGIAKENKAINYERCTTIDSLEETLDFTPDYFDECKLTPKTLCLKNEEFKFDSTPISTECISPAL
jgi:hypothetical protein